MQLGTREFAQWCFNRTVRVGRIICVGGAHDGECCSNELQDLIDETEDSRLGDLFQLPKLAARIAALEKEYRRFDDQMSIRVRREEIIQYLVLNDRNGFVVGLERAVHEYRPGGSSTFSWGHFATKDLYADSLDEAFVQRIVAWADEREKAERVESRKKKGAQPA